MTSKIKVEKVAQDGLTQSERFIEAARRHETDDDPERFKETVRKLAKVKPEKGAIVPALLIEGESEP